MSAMDAGESSEGRWPHPLNGRLINKPERGGKQKRARLWLEMFALATTKFRNIPPNRSIWPKS